MNSKEKLVVALTEYLDKTSSEEGIGVNLVLGNMIERAREGYYSDFDSPLASPSVQLVKDLTEIGAESLVKLAMKGDFDATNEESDDWYRREGRDLALNSFGLGEGTIDLLFGKPDKD